MAHKYKLVGNLVFDQEEGKIYHAKTAEELAKFPVKLEIPVHLHAHKIAFKIDTTGVKKECGHFKLLSQALKHLTEAYFAAYLSDPTATDAEVHVELVDLDSGTAIASLTYAGEGGYKESSNIAESLKDYADKVLYGEVEVVTASATADASQTLHSITLLLVYDFT